VSGLPREAYDFDDLLAPTTVPVVAHYNKQYGTNVHPDQYYDPNTNWGITDGDEIGRRMNEFVMTPAHLELPPMEGAVEVLTEAKEKAELWVITGRPARTREATEAYLDRWFTGIFAGIEFTASFDSWGRPKAEACHELGITRLFDDLPKHCQSVAESGIPTVLYGDYAWNRDVQLHRLTQRALDWAEIRLILNGTKLSTAR